MISAFLFFIHFILAIYAFITSKKESVGDGLLSVAFVCIIFAVGWTIATFLTNLLFSITLFADWYWQPLNSWVWIRLRKEISRDTISLLILTSGEIVFYYYYFFMDKNSDQKIS